MTFFWNWWQKIWWQIVYCYSSKSKSNTNSLKSVIDVTVSKIGDTDGNQSGESGVTCDDFEDGEKVAPLVTKASVDNVEDNKVDNVDKVDEIGDGNESESSYEYEEIEIEVTDSEEDDSDSDEISKNNSNSKKISASERETSMASIRKFSNSSNFILVLDSAICKRVSREFSGSFRGVFLKIRKALSKIRQIKQLLVVQLILIPVPTVRVFIFFPSMNDHFIVRHF